MFKIPLQQWLPPHLRIIFLFVLGLILSVLNHLPTLGILSVISFLLLSNTKTPQTYYRLWLKVNVFMVLVWLSLSWQIKLEPTWHITAYPHGIFLAALITLKFNIIFCLSRVLFDGSNKIEIIHAFNKLKLSRNLVILTVLMLNYIDVFMNLKKKQDLAMKARGYQWHWRLKNISFLAMHLSTLLIHAHEKSQTVHNALKARRFEF